jgi:hypothetical protein
MSSKYERESRLEFLKEKLKLFQKIVKRIKEQIKKEKENGRIHSSNC